MVEHHAKMVKIRRPPNELKFPFSGVLRSMEKRIKPITQNRVNISLLLAIDSQPFCSNVGQFPFRSLELSRCLLCVLLLLGLIAIHVAAKVRFPSIFGSHMVLQRNQANPIWGWAEVGEKVTVSIARAIAHYQGRQ